MPTQLLTTAEIHSQPIPTQLTGKQIPLSQIPVIDFGQFLDGDDTQRRAVAAEIGAACRGAGFFYIQNHGIEPRIFDAVYAQGQKFFALPTEEKMKIYIGTNDRNRGYSPMLEEKLSKKGDLKESFDLALELGEDDADVQKGARLYGPNLWPKDDVLPDFRQTIYDDYYLRVLDLGRHVLQAFALALDLPQDYFADKTRKPMCNLRVLHYPPQQGVIDPDMLGCGAHTDYECFTLLAQSDAGGLQVQNASGEWIEAPPIAGTFVVNIGDMMARWTNDVFASTPHRVINRSGRERMSLPFFFGADYFATVECLETCRSENNPPRYAPVMAGDYLMEIYERTFASRQKEAVAASSARLETTSSETA
ncbi:MAG TPA: 2-oxoglutarate and iron-dependent oxygenase domain-containing protein [Abditibacteriaceae bacterium]|jgi:isopenicillin N synthase-like dioxygenase|nr:2-oxoglutarate and iron-dependent oxygenase domain-containing protein [Abditibacteriaceae bacterium]